MNKKSMQLLTGRCLCEKIAYEISGELAMWWLSIFALFVVQI
jgi:hypothetical protein